MIKKVLNAAMVIYVVMLIALGSFLAGRAYEAAYGYSPSVKIEPNRTDRGGKVRGKGKFPVEIKDGIRSVWI